MILLYKPGQTVPVTKHVDDLSKENILHNKLSFKLETKSHALCTSIVSIEQ